jgi:hypothetical protein
MRDTRAEGEGVSNVPTLLHYLVYFLSKSDDDVVNFRQDISHLQAAAKCKYCSTKKKKLSPKITIAFFF